MRKLLPLLLAPLFLTSCIAYSVGTTARPVPKGEFQPSMSAYFVPNGIEDIDDGGDSLAYASADFEGRWGLSDKSDLGLRVPPGGVIINYKRLLSAENDPTRSAFAAMGGTGIVNWGNHAYVEAALLASGPEGRRVPYGGVRVMQVLPIASGAVTDTPSAGIFGGYRLRLGTNFSISPELGIYHDKSALGLRSGDLLVIPSVSFHWN